jgi:hypothetical protein
VSPVALCARRTGSNSTGIEDDMARRKGSKRFQKMSMKLLRVFLLREKNDQFRGTGNLKPCVFRAFLAVLSVAAPLMALRKLENVDETSAKALAALFLNAFGFPTPKKSVNKFLTKSTKIPKPKTRKNGQETLEQAPVPWNSGLGDLCCAEAVRAVYIEPEDANLWVYEEPEEKEQVLLIFDSFVFVFSENCGNDRFRSSHKRLRPERSSTPEIGSRSSM